MKKKSKSIDNSRLAQISSLEELRTAKRRIDCATTRFENDLYDNYLAARDTYSIRGVIMNGLAIADDLQSVIRYARNGYNMACGARRRRGCKG